MNIFSCSLLFCTLFSSATSSNLRTKVRKLNTLQFDELKLINADSELEVNATVVPFATNTINVQDLINGGAPSMTLKTSFNINATVSGGQNVQVIFDNGQLERSPFYTRCGNNGDNFRPCSDLKVGFTTNVTATARDSSGNTAFVWAVLVFIDGTSAPTTPTPTMAPTFSQAPTSVTPPEPTLAPTGAPVTTAPTARAVCDEEFCPYFDGPWQASARYPLKVTEAQGGMIGQEMIVIGGFEAGFANVTRKNYARNLTDPKAPWRQLDDMPVEGGITHAGFAIVNKTLLYMCGGYIGAAPGPQTDICLIFNHTAPSGSQWSMDFPKLPEPRGGGGMVYSLVTNQLIFSAGGQRPNDGYALTVDYNTTWVYSFDNPSLGWVQKADIPYHANHVGFVTARDDQNRERLFFLGGHERQDKNSYVKSNYEWNATSETWIKRADMLIPGGHVSSSTIPVGNGFLIAGGSTNNVPGSKISDVYYYDIPSDSWHFIGHLNLDVNTPICGFGADNYFHCYTGTPGSFPANKRRLVVPLIN